MTMRMFKGLVRCYMFQLWLPLYEYLKTYVWIALQNYFFYPVIKHFLPENIDTILPLIL